MARTARQPRELALHHHELAIAGEDEFAQLAEKIMGSSIIRDE